MNWSLKPRACQVVAASGLDAWLGRVTGALRRPWIVGYHTVVSSEAALSELMPGLAITTRTFEQHLDWIGRRFSFSSLGELPLEAHGHPAGQKPLAAITFDDGYRGVFDEALPLLRRKGIPAALFVVTDRVGSAAPLVHDQLYRMLRECCSEEEAYNMTRALLRSFAPAALARFIRRLGSPAHEDAPDLPLTWPMLQTLRAAGWTIGSHTRSHALLSSAQATPAALSEETLGSRMALALKLGAAPRHFAYPDGAFNPGAVAAVASAGYEFAYTACAHQDPAHLQLTRSRTMLWERSSLDGAGRFSPSVLACQSSGLVELVAGCHRDHGAPARSLTP